MLVLFDIVVCSVFGLFLLFMLLLVFIVVWCCSLIGYGGCLYLFVLLVGLVRCV